MSKPVPAVLFGLKSWTIKKTRSGRFYVVPTNAMAFRKRPWSGPYKSLLRATHAIAVKMSIEFTDRNARQSRFYRNKERAR